MNQLSKFSFWLLTTLALSACGSSTPSTDLYVLRPASDAAVRCTPSMAVQIDKPAAGEEFAMKKIAVMLSNSHLNYYTGASWASPFPDQLRDYLRQDFLNHDGITLATDDGDEAKKLRAVSITIEEAAVENPEDPRVHLRLLVALRQGEHSKQLRINELVKPTANHMPEIIDAFNQAAGNSAEKIRNAMHLRCGPL